MSGYSAFERVPYREPEGLPMRWQDEGSGLLVEAVWLFLGDDPALTDAQFRLVRDYVRYYVEAPCWVLEAEVNGELVSVAEEFAAMRQRVTAATTTTELRAAMSDALALGLDPL